MKRMHVITARILSYIENIFIKYIEKTYVSKYPLELSKKWGTTVIANANKKSITNVFNE